MPAKAQGEVSEPRIVFVSWYPEENFAKPVWESFKTKLEVFLVDHANRPIRLRDGSELLAGDTADATAPWEHHPTDVVVLFSDFYAKNFVSPKAIADQATRPLLNFLLRFHQRTEPAPYDLWFGVVQNTRWKNVPIEDKYLRDFEAHLKNLHPKIERFERDPDDARVLDNAIADAVDLFCGFVSAPQLDAPATKAAVNVTLAGTTPLQQPPASAPSEPAPPRKSGWFNKLFGKARAQ